MSTQYIINNSDSLLTGQTINGDLTITSAITASAFYGDGSNLSGVTSTLPYKVYTALLSQTGTTEPFATILENTLGVITYEYVSSGIYNIKSSSLFTENKTIMFFGGAGFGGGSVDQPVIFARYDESTLQGDAGGDNLIKGQPIEIRVYN